LADYGYVDGRNIVIDWFIAPTNADAPAYAVKAVASNPALIVTLGSSPPVAAKALTTTIPIVFTGTEGPVALGNGLITNFSRPGGNVTGILNGPLEEGDSKLTEIAKEMIPNLERIAFLVQPSDLGSAINNAANRRAAEALGLSAIFVEIEPGVDFEQLFVKATSMGAQAMIARGAYANLNVGVLAKLALQYGLPYMGSTPGTYANAGALAGRGENNLARIRRLGYYIDAVLKGAHPGDLPVEQLDKVEFIINLKTAKALGLTVPTSILLQATELLE
jgi:putative ABC transport system substrate-binding protein